jgi:hypothetical protein
MNKAKYILLCCFYVCTQGAAVIMLGPGWTRKLQDAAIGLIFCVSLSQRVGLISHDPTQWVSFTIQHWDSLVSGNQGGTIIDQSSALYS